MLNIRKSPNRRWHGQRSGGRSLVLALVLSAFGAAGGTIVATFAFPTAATAGVHPCQDDECEKDCPWYQPWCDDRECISNEGNGTYCDITENFAGDGECETKSCGHTE